MIAGIPENTLIELSRLVSIHTGLYFPEKKWPALIKGIVSVTNQLQQDAHHLLYCLRQSPAPKEILDLLTDRLTIGETYFLRDKNFFQILKDKIIPGLIRYPRKKARKIIFWCAGCATGEEPYSLAIVIDHILPEISGWEITIIGSDISQAALDKARAGVYSNWSFRETPEPLIKKYFSKTGDNRFELAPRIRRMVSFVQANLMTANYAASLNCHEPIDVIVCRNVLMYFNAQNRNSVIHHLTNSLVGNGWLITGPSESGFVDAPELTPVRFPNILCHRKGSPRQSDFPNIPIRMKPRKNIFSSITAKTRKGADRDIPSSRRISDAKPLPRPEKSIYDLYQEALTDYEQGKYGESAEKLSGIVSGTQNGNPSFLMRAESMILIARSYANLGELDQARTWCENAIRFEKLNPALYYLLSTIHQSANDLKGAVTSMKQAIYLDTGFIMAHFMLGMLFQQKNQLHESARSMDTALSLLRSKDPDDVLEHAEGMTVSRLVETIKSMTARSYP